MTSPIVTELCSTASPWLAIVLCLQRLMAWRGFRLRGGGQLFVAGGVGLAILLIPVERIAVARWITGINANFSVALLATLVVTVYERAFARMWFSPRDWDACWMFGAVGGLALYPFAFGLSRLDLYEWGWHGSPLFAIMAVLTGWLLWKQLRFGFVLLCAAAAFQLQLLESTNYWDYLLDPIYVLVSFVMLIRRPFSVRAARRVPQGSP
jgi:hypothetical protein